MPRLQRTTETPLYLLDAFSQKAKDYQFYVEKMQSHLDNHKFVSKPHKHDFYLLLYITKGSGTHSIDFKTYPVKAGSFFTMTPGQVHSWNLEPGTDGYIIFFLPAFYKMQSINNSLVAFPFFNSLNTNPIITLDAHQQKTTTMLMECIHNEFTGVMEMDLRVLRNYLEILLLKLSRNYAAEFKTDHTNKSTFKIRQLEELIEKHYIKKKQPRDYADMMNLSPSYLNAICKEALGKTLTDLISDRLILEAKRLFSYTDLNVSQVSNKLNFSDSSYFIRFFRKHVDMTPEQFKESLNRA